MEAEAGEFHKLSFSQHFSITSSRKDKNRMKLKFRVQLSRFVGNATYVGLTLLLLLSSLLVGPSNTAFASSHREAPLISQDPVADNTDLYAFVSPDRPGTVTILANFIPLEPPAGGPNFYEF